MKPETIQHAQTQLRSLYHVVKLITTYWGDTFPHLQIMCTFLQHMFATPDAKIKELLAILTAMSKYAGNSDPFSTWIASEAEMIIMDNEMFEEYEEDKQEQIPEFLQ